MALIGINHEDEQRELIKRALDEGLASTVEIIPDGYAYHDDPGALRERLDYYGVPFAFHFIDNSWGSVDFAQNSDLDANARLIRAFKPTHSSDHVNLCRAKEIDLRQNVAPPRTPEMLEVFVRNIRLFMSRVPKHKVLVENVSAHWEFAESSLGPAEFYRELVVRSGAYFLLDVHNIYVDEVNGGDDPVAFIEALPAERIAEIHVSGGSWSRTRQTYKDSHDSKTPGRVLELLDVALRRARPDTIVLERRSETDLEAMWTEMRDDLVHINEIDRRWTRKRKSA